MIEINVNVSAGCKVNPAAWDTAGGLEAAVKRGVENALQAVGYDVSVAVKASIA